MICKVSFFLLVTCTNIAAGQMNSGLSQLQQQALAQMQQAKIQQRAQQSQQREALAAQRAAPAAQRAEQRDRGAPKSVSLADLQGQDSLAKLLGSAPDTPAAPSAGKRTPPSRGPTMSELYGEAPALKPTRAAEQLEKMRQQVLTQGTASAEKRAPPRGSTMPEGYGEASALKPTKAAEQLEKMRQQVLTQGAAPAEQRAPPRGRTIADMYGEAPALKPTRAAEQLEKMRQQVLTQGAAPAEKRAPPRGRAMPEGYGAASSVNRATAPMKPTKAAEQLEKLRQEALKYSSEAPAAQRSAPRMDRAAQASSAAGRATPRTLLNRPSAAGAPPGKERVVQDVHGLAQLHEDAMAQLYGGKQQSQEDSPDMLASSIMEGFDTNGDGKISLYELMDHVGDAHTQFPEFEGWHEGFSQADADDDMHLTLEELSNLLQHVGDQDKQMQISDAKARHASIAANIMTGLDGNGDGKISLQELLSNLKDEHHRTPEFKGWHKGFQQADANGDMHLNVEELADLLMAAQEEL